MKRIWLGVACILVIISFSFTILAIKWYRTPSSSPENTGSQPSESVTSGSDDIVIEPITEDGHGVTEERDPASDGSMSASAEELLDSANASIVDDDSVVTQEVEAATEVMPSAVTVAEDVFGEDFPEVCLTYVETVDTGVKNHIFAIDKTDVVVIVTVAEDGTCQVQDPSNKYGSDYSCVYFEVEPDDRLAVYDFLATFYNINNYVYSEGGVITLPSEDWMVTYGESAAIAE